MVPLRTAQDFLSCKNSTSQLNPSSSNLNLKTYSKRVLQDSYKPPSKRQRVETPESTDKIIRALVQPTTPSLRRKRAIPDYFKTVTYSNTPSTPQSSVFSSDPVHKEVESPPSSPPLPHAAYTTAIPRIRERRRLKARPPLGLLKIADMNAGGSRKCLKAPPSFMPGSPLRESYLSKTSPPGLRQASRGGTSSEEGSGDSVGDNEAGLGREYKSLTSPVGIRPSRIPRLEPLTAPFAPTRKHTSYGSHWGQRLSGNSEQLPADTHTESLLTFPRGTVKTLGKAKMSVPNQLADSHKITGHVDSYAASPLRSTVSSGRSVHLAVSATTSTQATGNSAEIPSNFGLVPAVLGSANQKVGIPMQASVQATGSTPLPSGNFVQMQLNLGSSTSKTCKTCGFVFNSTVHGDIRAHLQAHDIYTSGVLVGGQACPPRLILQAFPGTGDKVIVVTRSSPQSWKNLVMTVLATHVDKELGSGAISADRLWSSIPDPAATRPASEAEQVDKYKVYMYIKVPPYFQVGRVVSLLLAERIARGFEMWNVQLQRNEKGKWPAEVIYSQPIRLNRSHEAVMGVNKFWTLQKERKNGYGTQLLDEARGHFIFGYTIPRIQLAWTQTTEDGAKYAKTYMQDEAAYDYLTYDEM